jgi:hypothetical protein
MLQPARLIDVRVIEVRVIEEAFGVCRPTPTIAALRGQHNEDAPGLVR